MQIRASRKTGKGRERQGLDGDGGSQCERLSKTARSRQHFPSRARIISGARRIERIDEVQRPERAEEQSFAEKVVTVEATTVG